MSDYPHHSIREARRLTLTAEQRQLIGIEFCPFCYAPAYENLSGVGPGAACVDPECKGAHGWRRVLDPSKNDGNLYAPIGDS
jgi:hypothetical protein